MPRTRTRATVPPTPAEGQEPSVGALPQQGDPLGEEGGIQLEGGPPADGAVPLPATVKLSLGLEEVELPEPVAAAVQAHIKDLSDKVAGLEARLSAPPPSGQPPASKPATPPAFDVKEFTAEFFKDPEAGFAKLVTHIEERLTSKYQQANGIDRFWSDFYAAHPNLDRATSHKFVEAVLNEHMGELAPMQASIATKRLGELTMARFQAMARKAGFQPAPPKLVKRATEGLEGGSATPVPGGQPAGPAPEDRPKSLTALLRQKNELRRNPTLRQVIREN